MPSFFPPLLHQCGTQPIFIDILVLPGWSFQILCQHSVTVTFSLHTQHNSPLSLTPQHLLITLHFDVKYHHKVTHVAHFTAVARLLCSAVSFHRALRVIGRPTRKLLTVLHILFIQEIQECFLLQLSPVWLLPWLPWWQPSLASPPLPSPPTDLYEEVYITFFSRMIGYLYSQVFSFVLFMFCKSISSVITFVFVGVSILSQKQNSIPTHKRICHKSRKRQWSALILLKFGAAEFSHNIWPLPAVMCETR